MERDADSRLLRFNIPFELRLFFRCKRFGGAKQRAELEFVMDRDAYNNRRSISDLAGVDIIAHNNKGDVIVAEVGNRLQNTPGISPALGDERLQKRHLRNL